MEYFRNLCPARMAGLTHVKDTRVRPDGSCLYCAMPLTETPPTGVPSGASEAQRVQYAEVFDHQYEFTVVGRCALCQKPKDAHATILIGVEDDASCTVDHASVKPWSACPICNVIVEPKMATGVPQGKEHGPGRGDLTERLKARLQSWLGWVDFNGGR